MTADVVGQPDGDLAPVSESKAASGEPAVEQELVAEAVLGLEAIRDRHRRYVDLGIELQANPLLASAIRRSRLPARVQRAVDEVRCAEGVCRIRRVF